MNNKISHNQIALAGEFAVLSKLALHGYDANLTLGNTKNVDILISNPENGKMYQLEVKTTRKNIVKPSKIKIFGLTHCTWMMNKKQENIVRPDLYYCFVNIGKANDEYSFYIVPSGVVAQYLKIEHKYWLKYDKKHQHTDMRTFRLGFKGQEYPIETPLVEKYKNNWRFKK